MRPTTLMIALVAGGMIPPNCADGAAPRNVILCIGDGMGYAQVDATGWYLFGDAYGHGDSRLFMQSLPYHAQMTTHSADLAVTDSAASGTAMATGRKVNNGVVSLAIPGDGHELDTVLEHSHRQGRRTGLVTTTFIAHATPATFGAHEDSRYNYTEIIGDYLLQTRPDVLLGGAAYVTAAQALSAEYTVVSNRPQLVGLDTSVIDRLWGMFGNDHLPYELDGLGELPHLSDMTKVALDLLDNDPSGFFLMVEGGRIDHAGHANDIDRLIPEVIEFDRAVRIVLEWAAGRTDTLVIVTADHETGGLNVLAHGAVGEIPTVSWSTTWHTAARVPVYAWGMNASLVRGVLDNSDISAIVRRGQPPPGDLNNDGLVNTADLSWMVACMTGPAPVVCCDFDRDGDNDQSDLVAWVSCLGGPGHPADGTCQVMDLDLSHTVDLLDWAILQSQWSASSVILHRDGCHTADFDLDSDIDLRDLAQFQDVMLSTDLPGIQSVQR